MWPIQLTQFSPSTQPASLPYPPFCGGGCQEEEEDVAIVPQGNATVADDFCDGGVFQRYFFFHVLYRKVKVFPPGYAGQFGKQVSPDGRVFKLLVVRGDAEDGVVLPDFFVFFFAVTLTM